MAGALPPPATVLDARLVAAVLATAGASPQLARGLLPHALLLERRGPRGVDERSALRLVADALRDGIASIDGGCGRASLVGHLRCDGNALRDENHHRGTDTDGELDEAALEAEVGDENDGVCAEHVALGLASNFLTAALFERHAAARRACGRLRHALRQRQGLRQRPRLLTEAPKALLLLVEDIDLLFLHLPPMSSGVGPGVDSAASGRASAGPAPRYNEVPAALGAAHAALLVLLGFAACRSCHWEGRNSACRGGGASEGVGDGACGSAARGAGRPLLVLSAGSTELVPPWLRLPLAATPAAAALRGAGSAMRAAPLVLVATADPLADEGGGLLDADADEEIDDADGNVWGDKGEAGAAALGPALAAALRRRIALHLWLRLPRRAQVLSLAQSQAPASAPTPAAAAGPLASEAWPGVAGYAALRRRLTEAVIAPIAAAALARVREPPCPSLSSSASASPLPEPEASAASLARLLLRMRVGPPRGVLLFGPSGCGKTLLARALARAARMSLLHVQCPQLLSRFVGDSEAGLRAVFAAARRAAPCLLLLDDIDCVAGARAGLGTAVGAGGATRGPARGRLHGRGARKGEMSAGGEGAGWSSDDVGDDDDDDDDEAREDGEGSEKGEPEGSVDEGADAESAALSRAPNGGAGGGAGVGVLDRLLSTLLNEMDGVGHRASESDPGSGPEGGGARAPFVLVVGTTSRARVLDAALLRAGRLELHAFVGRPRRADRAALLAAASVGVALSPAARARLPELARGATAGASCAQLAALLSEAGLRALAAGAAQVGLAHVRAALAAMGLPGDGDGDSECEREDD